MIGFPKPQRILIDRVERKREQDRRGQAFRQAVWKRDEGKCRSCGRLVRRTFELVPERGEVHHRRGRNVAPEDKYNVAKALLLCATCHGDPKVVQKFRRGV